MLILFNPSDSKIKITANDLDLSKTQQKALVVLSENPKSASEVGKEAEMPLTTTLVSLKELKQKDMVFSEKPKIKMETESGIMTKKSDVEYWQLTGKGMLWVMNICSAMGIKEPKGFMERLQKKFPKLVVA